MIGCYKWSTNGKSFSKRARFGGPFLTLRVSFTHKAQKDKMQVQFQLPSKIEKEELLVVVSLNTKKLLGRFVLLPQEQRQGDPALGCRVLRRS